MKIIEHNVETGEVLERDMTAVEQTQYEIDQAVNAARLAIEETKAVARQAVLDRLGLTEEEAQLILGGSN
jgi:hypothetical protein